jgi:hypothetical protein
LKGMLRHPFLFLTNWEFSGLISAAADTGSSPVPATLKGMLLHPFFV